MRAAHPIPADLTWWRQAVRLVLAGLPGVVILGALMPDPLVMHPGGAESLPPAGVLRAAMVVQALVLLVAAACLGALTAQALGLRSVLAGTAAQDTVRRGWLPAVVAGCAVGTGVVALDAWLAPWLGPAWQQVRDRVTQPTVASLLIGVAYGGVTEEILLRWGAMGVSAWGLWRLMGRRRAGVAVTVAAVLAALLFGWAHVPAVAALIEPTPAIVARTVALNAVAGLVYARLFWRHHLEAAMLAHVCSHLAMGAWLVVG